MQLNGVLTHKQCCCLIDTLSFFLSSHFSVVSQDYITRVHEIDVILGNSGLLKCEIPSFVIDFVTVSSWIDNKGSEHFLKTQSASFTGNFFRNPQYVERILNKIENTFNETFAGLKSMS